MKQARLRLSVSIILAFVATMAAISLTPSVFTESPPPLTGMLSIEVPATVGEGDGSVSYTVGMVLAEDQQPSANARLSVNVSSSNDVAYAPDDFVAVDDDFTFALARTSPVSRCRRTAEPTAMWRPPPDRSR